MYAPHNSVCTGWQQIIGTRSQLRVKLMWLQCNLHVLSHITRMRHFSFVFHPHGCMFGTVWTNGIKSWGGGRKTMSFQFVISPEVAWIYHILFEKPNQPHTPFATSQFSSCKSFATYLAVNSLPFGSWKLERSRLCADRNGQNSSRLPHRISQFFCCFIQFYRKSGKT